MRRRNFLKLTNKRKAQIIAYGVKRKWNWNKLSKYYKGPSWCSCTTPLNGEMGCFSLVGLGNETRKGLYRRKCNSCELSKYYIDKETLR